MPRNTKQTSARAASAASKVLRDGRTSKASKTAAGSALSQTPKRKKQDTVILAEGARQLLCSAPSVHSLHRHNNLKD